MRGLLISWVLLFCLITASVKSQVTGQRNIEYASAPASLQASVLVKGYGQSYIQTSCEYLNGNNESGNSFLTKYDSVHNVVVSIKVSQYLIRGICEDAAGNFYTIGIDAGTLPTVSLLKISAAGTITWKKTIPQTDYSNTFIPDYYPYDFYKAILLSNGNILFNCFANNSRALLLFSANGTLLNSADIPVIIGDIEQGFNNTLTATYFNKIGFWGDYVTESGVIQFDQNLRIIRNKKISIPSSFFIYGVSTDKSGFYYLNGVDSSGYLSTTAGGIIIKLDSQLNTIPNNTTAFVSRNKKNCNQTNDGRYFKITLNGNSIAVIENLFFVSLQNSITYNNNKYVSVPVLNFDTALNLKWSKNMLIRQDSLNPLFMISDDIVELKDNFIFSLRSNLNKAFLYYADTAGNTGNCYNTAAGYAARKRTTLFTDTTFSISPSLFTAQPSTLATTSVTELTVISTECVPPLKPVSDFVTDYTNQGSDTSTICLNTAVSFIDSSKNDPSVFNWLFPPAADLSNADSTCFPNINNVIFKTEGVFPVQLIACNNFGCDTVTKFIQVRITAIPPNLGNDTTICPGDSIAIVYTDILNSTHTFTGSNGLFTSQDTVFIKESGTYQCTVTSGCGLFSDDITVTVLPKPAAAFTYELFCDSLKVLFTGTSQTNGNIAPVYQWSYFSAAGVLLGTIANENPGFIFPSFDSFDIKLVAGSSQACFAEDSITERIYLKEKPKAAFTTATSCGNLLVRFINNSTVTADTIATYNWDFGSGQTSTEKDPLFTFSSYGNKTVKLTVTGSRGCTAEKTMTFDISNEAVSAGADTIIIQNTAYTLQGSGAVSYEWQPAALLNNAYSPNPVTILKNEQLFTLKATDANGCTGYDSVLIKVIGDIFIPNAFSPSGINKVWRIRQLSNYKSVRLSVYNRYGQKVFEGGAANDYTWDGTFNNKPQAPGAYLYVLQTDDGKRIRSFSGTVMLVR